MSHVLHGLYEAVDSPEGFHGVAHLIAEQFDSERIHLMLLDQAQAPLLQGWHDGNDLATCALSAADYSENWQHKDPRFKAALSGLGRVHSDVDVIEARAFERSHFYNDFMRPIGQRYTMFTTTPLHGGQALALACMRPRELGHFQVDEVERLTGLVPHLGRAMRLRALLDEANAKASALESAFEQLPVLVVVVDTFGRSTFVNSGARAVLDEGDGLCWKGGVLSATLPADAANISAAIARLAAFADDDCRGRAGAGAPETVCVRRSDGSLGTVTLFPLLPSSPLRGDESSSRVLCVLYDPSRRPLVDGLQLRGLFGLTPTESELVNALVEGKSLAEFAAQRGSGLEAARTHMKRVLQKTNTRSQADLVRDLLGRLGLQRLPGAP